MKGNHLKCPRKEKKDGEMILEKLVHFMRHKRKGKSCIAIATHYLKTKVWDFWSFDSFYATFNIPFFLLARFVHKG